jgi:inorganic pyrophosphatase
MRGNTRYNYIYIYNTNLYEIKGDDDPLDAVELGTRTFKLGE